ncbi:MAG TPA: hypothetical protein VHT95_05840 [Vicinamibacterales bacterium]|nr:hypothetical protein [Vicinamibacterales bacterium]
MRSRDLVGRLVLAAAVLSRIESAGAAPPTRKLLGPHEREAVLALIKAVDVAQANDVGPDPEVAWEYHVLKSANYTGYVPFTLTPAKAYSAAAMYVRAVSRHDGVRSSSEHSHLRDWLLNNRDVRPRQSETMWVGIGEMPLAGLAGASSRPATAAAAAASAALRMQANDLEKAIRAAGEAKRKAEARQLDPLVFPFEEYYFFELGSTRAVERALALPPGEYDVYVGMIDRARVKTSSPAIVRRTVTVPDFWDDRLALSSLILARDLRALKAAFPAPQQAEHPYAFGSAEVVPASGAAFAADEALTVVYQMCNYGAPDSDVTANYTFYRLDGGRRLFNRTNTQQLSDVDLPAAGAWESQAFVSQTVPLQPFPPGQYELEVEVRDRVTRGTAKASVAFTVVSGLR